MNDCPNCRHLPTIEAVLRLEHALMLADALDDYGVRSAVADVRAAVLANAHANEPARTPPESCYLVTT